MVSDLQPHPQASHAVAVGWIEAEPYSRGPVSAAFIDLLWAACTDPVKQIRLMRGWHACTLCGPGAPYPVVEVHGEQSSRLGHSEIEVVGADGVTYAAPQLIFHYVVTHGYQPPSKFVDAVLRGTVLDDRTVYIQDFERIEPQMVDSLRRVLTDSLGLSSDLGERVDVRVAVGTIGVAREPLRALYVAQAAVPGTWDGTLACGRELLARHCKSHDLVFDGHWAKWRHRNLARPAGAC